MSELSRRHFFKNLIPASKSNLQQQASVSHFKLGHISAFPVGSEAKLNLMNKCLVVRSLPEGLQLIDQSTNQNYGLAIGPDGQLIGDLSVNWPSHSVLSIFSGEIYNF